MKLFESISVDDARRLVEDHVPQAIPVLVALSEATGLLLAEEIHSPIDVPAFDQSNMDGYAIRFADRMGPLPIAGVQSAGPSEPQRLPPGAAMRIFTGAPVPEGADTIVMQEKTRVEEGKLLMTHDDIQYGEHFRKRGSAMVAGALALPAGVSLQAPHVGFLAGMGIAEVKVLPRPRVTIIVTGNELQDPGKPLGHGQVYEANSFALTAALRQLGMEPLATHQVPDDPFALEAIFRSSISVSDMVLVTGGVSVGDHDHTRPAAERCGVRTIFHKVRQRPGKPLYFGLAGEKSFFGLPGNPASVLSCFYQYVTVAISLHMGRSCRLEEKEAVLEDAYKKPAGMTHFLRAEYDEGRVWLLAGQESYKMDAFSRANAFVELPEGKEVFEVGEMVKVHLL